MTTETTERKMKKAGGTNFPPLIVLQVGETIKGHIEAAEIVTVKAFEKTTVKGKTVEKEVEREKMYYRIKLSADATVHFGKKQEDGSWPVRLFEDGEMVTLPDSGDLSRKMREIALTVEGKDPKDKEAEADFAELGGVYVEVTRLVDDKMKKGSFKGNKVKVYDVAYEA